MNKQSKRLDPGNIIITTLPPIPTEGLTPEDVEELMEKTRNQMNEVFVRTSNEVKELSKPLEDLSI